MYAFCWSSKYRGAFRFAAEKTVAGILSEIEGVRGRRKGSRGRAQRILGDYKLDFAQCLMLCIS